MQKPMPQLNALKAFEAAARHLSLTKAGKKLHVTAGALEPPDPGLEELSASSSSSAASARSL